MQPQQDRLNLLLERYTDKTLSAPEQEELSTLLLQDWNELSNEKEAPVDWELMVQQIIAESNSKRRIHFIKTEWFKYAAAILIILSTVAYLWNTQEKENPLVTQADPVPMQSDVAPGGNRAVLTLAEGRNIVLDTTANGKLSTDGRAIVVKNDGSLKYSRLSIVDSRVTSHTLTTPRGGQYQLELPDGSKVWLNAASSITYPTAFNGSNREVTVTGEVYFEVAKDAKKKFIVEVPTSEYPPLSGGTERSEGSARSARANGGGLEIEVLGTHFNVNAYTEENRIRTTLLEGSVKIKTQNKALVIKPNQQVAFTNQQLTLTENANIRQVMAWKNGLFILSNTDVPTIMRQISRWYDVDVKYEATIPTKKLGGGISRNLPLSEILDLLKNYGVQFRLEGKTLFVRP